MKSTASAPRARRVPPALDPEAFERMALRYVERFATSRGKLADYLKRKLRERGWAEGAAPPDPHALAERMAALGYVDDAAYAAMKARSLTQRGYGRRRVGESLRAAGIDADDGAAAMGIAEEEAEKAAWRFARRRRLGPFGPGVDDPKARARALAAMLRAGHDIGLARRILSAPLPEQH